MKNIMLFTTLLSMQNLSYAEEYNCSLEIEKAKTISLHEFYFGHHIETITFTDGPTVSLWGFDRENTSIENNLQTNLLISFGFGDIDEEPQVFRIKSANKIDNQEKPLEYIFIENNQLKIEIKNKQKNCKKTITTINEK